MVQGRPNRRLRVSGGVFSRVLRRRCRRVAVERLENPCSEDPSLQEAPLSIAHLGLAASDSQSERGQSSGYAGGSGYDRRTPPHDLLAEQSTIGGMLLSKDATADVIETVRAADFYLPKHEVIFNA